MTEAAQELRDAKEAIERVIAVLRSARPPVPIELSEAAKALSRELRPRALSGFIRRSLPGERTQRKLPSLAATGLATPPSLGAFSLAEAKLAALGPEGDGRCAATRDWRTGLD